MPDAEYDPTGLTAEELAREKRIAAQLAAISQEATDE